MLLFLVVLASITSGLFGGMALQKLIVELPARKKIGVTTFARYARASDLGNGLFIYPLFAVINIILTIASFMLTLNMENTSTEATLLGLATGCGLGVLIMTIFAAPQMFRLGKLGDQEELLTSILEKFVLYSWPRAVFIWIQFGLLLWVLHLLR